MVGGDILWLQSGNRAALTIRNLSGSSGNPIWVMNSGGLVNINSGTITLAIENCQYLHISGRGYQYCYGIRVQSYTNYGVQIREQSEYIEIDRVEIGPAGVGGDAGMSIRTLLAEAYEGYVMHDIHVHHCYFHGCNGEAMYCNHHSTQTNPGTFQDGFVIENNYIDGCGYDGIQVRYGNFVIQRNRIMDCGDSIDGTAQPGSGIIVAHEAEDTIVRWNWITDCVRGIHCEIQGTGVEIYENLIEDMNDSATKDAYGIWLPSNGNGAEITHNTVVDVENEGFKSKSGDTGGTVRNNIFAGCGASYDTDYSTDANNEEDTIVNMDFRSSDVLRHITGDSPAYEAAHDGSHCGWTQSV